MRFIGRTTSGVTDGSDMQTVLIDGAGTTAQAGDVVLKGNKEFIWAGSAWEELGDEQSHALKSVTVTGSGLLEGGGSLEANREITHKKVTTGSTTSNEDKSSGGSFTAIDGIATDGYGHVTSVNTKTVSVGNTTYSLSVANATDSSSASITLTPSSGEAQTVELETVYNAKSADKATHDTDGNIIASTYVKKTSEQLLSGWAQTFATYLNKETYPNGIPYMSSSKSSIYSELIGGYATVSALDYLSLYDAKKKSVTLNAVTTADDRTYAVMRDADSNLVVNVPWTDTTYTLPAATESTLGGIKTTFTDSDFGLTFTNGCCGIKLVGVGSGIQFAGKNYRITDIETGSISFGSETFTAGTSVSKSVTFHNTNHYSSSGTLTTGKKYGTVHVYLQFVGYNGEDITCGLINLSDTGFTAYAKCQYSTLSASSTRYIHWIKVREY